MTQSGFQVRDTAAERAGRALAKVDSAFRFCHFAFRFQVDFAFRVEGFDVRV